jgi:hypothetical protein
MALHPPRLAERLLRIAFREPELRETVLGDLCEDFLDRAERAVWRARIWYWKEAAAICLSVTVRRQLARLVDGGNGFLLRGRLMGGFVNDLRQAARTFRRHPATALLVVLTLGIGIGSSSAVFSILKRALVPAYPFEEPDRLVVLETYDGTTSSRLSVPDLIRIRDQVGTMSRTAGYRTRSYTLVGQNLPERVTAAHVTSGFFALLGVQTSGTADFEPIDDAPGGPRRGLLSASAAIRLFGSVDGALGGALTLDGESYEVAGVLPSDFWFPDDVEVWLPAGLDEAFVESSETRLIYRAIGRMEQGVEPRAVMDELMALDGVDRAGDVRITATPLRRWLVGDAELVLMLLQVASGLLLLLGLTNATGMILALSFDRARERAVRVALGARVPDLLRATLAEGLTLSLAGGAVGLTLAFGAVQVLTSLVPADIVGPAEVGIDAMTVTVAFVAALVTGVVMSFLPGLRAVRGSDPAAAVRSWRTRPKEERRFQHAFLSVQVGLGLALTLAAVSLSRSLLSLAGNDVGFQEEGILTMRCRRRRQTLRSRPRPGARDILGLPSVRDELGVSGGSYRIGAEHGRSGCPPDRCGPRPGAAGLRRAHFVRAHWGIDPAPAPRHAVGPVLLQLGSLDPGERNLWGRRGPCGTNDEGARRARGPGSSEEIPPCAYCAQARPQRARRGIAGRLGHLDRRRPSGRAPSRTMVPRRDVAIRRVCGDPVDCHAGSPRTRTPCGTPGPRPVALRGMTPPGSLGAESA